MEVIFLPLYYLDINENNLKGVGELSAKSLCFSCLVPNRVCVCLLLLLLLGGHFFHRNSLSPRSLVYENDFSSIEPVLDMYDENKTWRGSAFFSFCDLSLFPFPFLIPLVVYSFHGCPFVWRRAAFSRTCAWLPGCKGEAQLRQGLRMTSVNGWSMCTKSAVGGCRGTKLSLAMPAWWCRYARGFALLSFSFIQQSPLLSRHMEFSLFKQKLQCLPASLPDREGGRLLSEALRLLFILFLILHWTSPFWKGLVRTVLMFQLTTELTDGKTSQHYSSIIASSISTRFGVGWGFTSLLRI